MKPSHSLLIFAGFAAIAFALSAPESALAKKKKRHRYEAWHRYAVEFTCGSNADDLDRVVPGDYATVINIHNASDDENHMEARVSLTFPGSSSSDEVSRNLDGNETARIDCDSILNGEFVLPVPYDASSYYIGFVLIESRQPLDVVVRNTATGAQGEVSVDVETVRAQAVSRWINGDDDDVEICHVPPGNPAARHTIEVGAPAVSAHMAHGDSLGECD